MGISMGKRLYSCPTHDLTGRVWGVIHGYKIVPIPFPYGYGIRGYPMDKIVILRNTTSMCDPSKFWAEPIYHLLLASLDV